MRHASTEDLARYDEDDLRPRKRARIAAHLAVCVHCSGNHHRLHAMASILADVSYPPMPEHLHAKINFAIASESASRVASGPATEASRRDLPERQRPARAGGRLSRLSSPLGLRLVAAAGAAVIVAGGGYAIANGLGSTGSSPSPSSAGAPVNGAAANLSQGPALHLKVNGRAEKFQAVRSRTDFKPATFQTQTLAAVSAMRQVRAHQTVLPSNNQPQSLVPTGSGSAGSSAPTPASKGLGQVAGNMSLADSGRLQACVGFVAAGRTLLLVESALFENKPATIIVVRSAGTKALEAYAVGAACSGSTKDVLYSLRLPGS